MAISKTRIAAEVLRVVPRRRVSRALGHLADLPAPTILLDRVTEFYIRAYNVDLSESEVPEGGFTSFNSFFTRRLKPGLRPLDEDPNALLSPADGVIHDSGPIRRNSTFLVKGKDYDVAELLGDSNDAARFDGGTFFIIYLSPRDYHRVHAPITGRVIRARHVAGTLYPVNAIGEHVPRLFARNERVVAYQHSDSLGDVVSVLVGAVGVGRVVTSFDESLTTNTGGSGSLREYGVAGPEIERGEELGMFELGSTVIVLTPSAWEPCKRAGDRVRVGEAIARRSTT